MSKITLDRLLALLVLALALTGLLTLRAGSPESRVLFVLHGVLGGALLAAVALKLRRSLPPAVAARRWRRLAVALVVTVLALGAVLIGFAAVAAGSLVVIGPWTLISWHALIGFVLVPLLVVHLLPQRWRLLTPRRRSPAREPATLRGSAGARTAADTPEALGTTAAPARISRRALLSGGLLGLAAVALWGGAEVIDRARGGVRRFTGSRWLPAGGVPPPTTFFGEGTQPIDPATWRLAIRGRVDRPATWTLEDLKRLGPSTIRATLDCTSGWAMETDWTGVPLARLLELAGADPGATRIHVRAVTGWGAGLAPADAARSFLALGVAGGPLPHGNGAPCRLVVPDRRGLDWVKWVTEIEVA